MKKNIKNIVILGVNFKIFESTKDQVDIKTEPGENFSYSHKRDERRNKETEETKESGRIFGINLLRHRGQNSTA